MLSAVILYGPIPISYWHANDSSFLLLFKKNMYLRPSERGPDRIQLELVRYLAVVLPSKFKDRAGSSIRCHRPYSRKIHTCMGEPSSGEDLAPTQPIRTMRQSLCTAHDFLDTVIAILDPTSGSHRLAIVVPMPTVCVEYVGPPGGSPDFLSPPRPHAAADVARKSRRT